MKKVWLVFVIVLLALSVAACGGSSLPNTFDFMYNEDGTYIRLGMTREEVEQRITFEEELEPSDFSPGGALGHGGTIVIFDENDTVLDISTFSDAWSIHGGITIGSTVDEIVEVFGEDYVHRFSEGWLLVRFNSDHNIVPWITVGYLEPDDYIISFRMRSDVFHIDISFASRHIP